MQIAAEPTFERHAADDVVVFVEGVEVRPAIQRLARTCRSLLVGPEHGAQRRLFTEFASDICRHPVLSKPLFGTRLSVEKREAESA